MSVWGAFYDFKISFNSFGSCNLVIYLKRQSVNNGLSYINI